MTAAATAVAAAARQQPQQHRQWLPRRLTVARANSLLQRGCITVKDLVMYCHELATLGENDKSWNLHAFVHLTPLDELLQAADAVDFRINSRISNLDGIPISLKANMASGRFATTASSRLLQEDVFQKEEPPPPNDRMSLHSDVSFRLLQESGALLIGITNMDEFGMGALGRYCGLSLHDEPPRRVATRNPLPVLLQHAHEIFGNLVDNDDNDEYWKRRILQRDELRDLYALLENHNKDKDQVWRSPGGSSCGSAVSVSFGSSLLSFGTDTGGSVRLPSAWCGVYGLKPTYGAISRFGILAFASSLDTVGILGPSASCVATAWGHVRNTPQRLTRDASAIVVPDSTPLSKRLLRVGIPDAFLIDECPPKVQTVWESFVKRLLSQHTELQVEPQVHRIPTSVLQPQTIGKSLPAYVVLACAEASSNLAKYDGIRYGTQWQVENNDENDNDDSWTDAATAPIPQTPFERQVSLTRAQGMGEEVKRRLLAGTAILTGSRFSSHYEAAVRYRAVLCRELHAALQEVDLLVLPTTIASPGPPLLFSDQNEENAASAFVNDVMTVPFNLAGLPALSIPVQVEWDNSDSEYPLLAMGMQLVGKHGTEDLLLQMAQMLAKEGSFQDESSPKE